MLTDLTNLFCVKEWKRCHYFLPSVVASHESSYLSWYTQVGFLLLPLSTFFPHLATSRVVFFSLDNGVALVVTYEVYFTSPSLPFLLSFFTSIEMLWELYIHYFCLCFIFILSHSLKIAVVPVSLEMQCDMYIFYTLAYHLNIIQKWYGDNDHYHCHQSALNEMWETRMHVNGTSRPWSPEYHHKRRDKKFTW